MILMQGQGNSGPCINDTDGLYVLYMKAMLKKNVRIGGKTPHSIVLRGGIIRSMLWAGVGAEGV